jgi:hypothetical protein
VRAEEEESRQDMNFLAAECRSQAMLVGEKISETRMWRSEGTRGEM